MKKWEQKRVRALVLGLLIGMAAGTLVGIFFRNIGMFLALGGLFGMVFGTLFAPGE